MAIASAADLVAALRKHQLLQATQIDEVVRIHQPRAADARSLARELIQRDLLTAYQINQLLQGRGGDLTLGSYVILERLGEGGMGQVFKARHRAMNRVVALKVIRKERLESADAIRRFQREIRAVAQLNHANIVRAFDADEVAGTQMLVMEYVEGTDLSKLVKQLGPLPVAQACDYIRQTALGLQHAHERGLVHRDIKPHNLLVSSVRRASPVGSGGNLGALDDGSPAADQLVKILDMGLARVNTAHTDGETSSLTQDGAVMGTPDYIAPEQAQESHSVDIRADLYSLGCTFYYILAGQPPFPTGSLIQKINKHQFEEPKPIEQMRPEVSAKVAMIVRRLMAKDPAKRYQTPWEVADALASVDREAAIRPAVGVVGTPGKLRDTSKPIGSADETIALAPEPPTVTSSTPHAAGRLSRRRMVAIVALVLIALVAAGLYVTRDKPIALGPDATRRDQAQKVHSSEKNPPLVKANRSMPAGAKVLFDGKDTSSWVTKSGAPSNWPVRDGYMEVGSGDLMTRENFDLDYLLHVEFWIPLMADQKGQGRGNSGVFLQGRYEIQILDSYQSNDPPIFSCGALYGILKTTTNASKPPEQWQTFDITFHAPRNRNNNTMLVTGRVTVVHNGVTVINDESFDRATPGGIDLKQGGSGPILLQAHGSKVRFRNIWLQPLPSD